MASESSSQRSFDLTLAVAALDGDRRYGVLVRAVKLLQGARSQHADILECEQTLERMSRLASIIEDDARDERVWLAEALSVHAIVLYARATHGSGVRAKAPDAPLTTIQREFHQHILEIRNKVIAHYVNISNQHEGSWLNDHVALHLGSRELTLSYPSLRASIKGRVLEELEELVTVTAAHYSAQAYSAQSEVIREASRLAAADPHFVLVLRRFPFSEIDFFGFDNPPSEDSSKLQRTYAAGTRVGVAGKPVLKSSET